MKKCISFILVMLCTASFVFVGCDSGKSKGASGKLPLRYYMPGAPTKEASVATNAINEALARDGLAIDFQPMYIPWDQWVDKINLMLSTGEEFELFHIMEDYVPTAAYASRNYLTPLNDLLPKVSPELTGRFEKVLWDSATVNGKIYSVPAFWRDNSGDYEGWVSIRKGKFDKYGLAVPQTQEQLLSTLATLQTRWAAEDGVKRYVYEHSSSRPPVGLHRTYSTWPFYTSLDGIFQVRQNGEANLYFDTDEFKRDAEFMNTLYTRGLIHPDILNLPADTRRSNLEEGDYLLGFATGAQNTYELTSRGITSDAEVQLYWLNSDKSYLMNLPLQNANGIPITAKHPEVALQFLDWMYKSQANQDLVLYGVQGQHWNPVGADKRSQVRGSDGNPLYAFDSWMIEYVKYHRFDVDDHSSDQEKANWLGNIFPDKTVISPVVGFNFNSEPVRVEYANVIAEYTASILPIKVGVLPYARNYAAASAKMKAAGSDKVIAEYRKQLAAFLASK